MRILDDRGNTWYVEDSIEFGTVANRIFMAGRLTYKRAPGARWVNVSVICDAALHTKDPASI